jgi:hypothetical protein
MSEPCPILGGDEILKYVGKFKSRGEQFSKYLTPGVISIIVLILFTAIYITGFYFYEKSKLPSPDSTPSPSPSTDSTPPPSPSSISIIYGILIYFATILPLSLLLYAILIYRQVSKGYLELYSEIGYQKGLFWGGSVLFILTGIIVCILLLEILQKGAINITFLIGSILGSLIISGLAGGWAHSVLKTRLSSEEAFKTKCAEEQIKSGVQLAKTRLEQHKRELEQKSKNVEESLKHLEPVVTSQNVDEVSRAIAEKPVGIATLKTVAEESRKSQQPPSPPQPFSPIYPIYPVYPLPPLPAQPSGSGRRVRDIKKLLKKLRSNKKVHVS